MTPEEKAAHLTRIEEARDQGRTNVAGRLRHLAGLVEARMIEATSIWEQGSPGGAFELQIAFQQTPETREALRGIYYPGGLS